MNKIFNKTLKCLIVFLVLLTAGIFVSCTKENTTLAPYEGQRNMTNVTIEAGVFKPKITWVGGYAAVVGVNKGSTAVLDSSIIWLIHTSGDNIHYPVTFGSLPAGAQDITSQFGGTKADSLSEDNTYTFWVLKEEVWNLISSQSNKYIKLDSAMTSSFRISGDTVFVSSIDHTQKTTNLDVYINIQGLSTFGQLGLISLQVKNSSKPIINWSITEAGITDTLISAIGIVEGSQYDPTKLIWEVYSESQDSGKTVYGKVNVIHGPLSAGQNIPGTHVFAEYPAAGLERGKGYYIWIAAKDWNGTDRLRFATSYAYATFNVR